MREPVETSSVIEALTRRLRSPLRRFFAKRMGKAYREEVDDLIQEVFVRLAAQGRLDSVENVEAYLFRTAANLLKDRHRRALSHELQSHERYVGALHDDSSQTWSPERELLGREALECLIAALFGLPERTRTVWALYHFEDLGHEEIARCLGMARSTVEKHMSRANLHLLKHAGRTKSESHHGP